MRRHSLARVAVAVAGFVCGLSLAGIAAPSPKTVTEVGADVEEESASGTSSAQEWLDLSRHDLLLAWLSKDLLDPEKNALPVSAVDTTVASRHATQAKTNYYPSLLPESPGRQLVQAGRLSLTRDPCNMNHSYFMGGDRAYAVGSLRGGFLRRGVLWGDEAGIWSQPYKMMDGILLAIEVDANGLRPLIDGGEAINRLAAMEFRWQERGLAVNRRDFAPDGESAYWHVFTWRNTTDRALRVRGIVTLQENIRPIWHRPWTQAYGPDEIRQEADGLWVARDVLIEGVEVAFGVIAPPTSKVCRRTDSRNPYRHRGETEIELRLEPGQEVEIVAGSAMWDQRKSAWMPTAMEARGAAAYWRKLHATCNAAWRRKVGDWERAIFGGVQFSCPEPELQAAYDAAKYNLRALIADTRPYLEHPHIMTCPERAYQHLFGIDPLYASLGATLAGFPGIARSTYDNHFFYAAQTGLGAIPFFVDHFGRHGNRGSRAQETTQFIGTVWAHLKLTGDRVAASADFPRLAAMLAAQEARDKNGDGWIEGMTFPGLTRQAGTDTMVCAAVRLCWATEALAEMAETLGLPTETLLYRKKADELRWRFNREWWVESIGNWATALRREPDGKVSQVVLGHLRYGSANYAQTYRIADQALGVRSLQGVWRDAVDEAGGFHGPAITVWQNSNMALAAYRYGLSNEGLTLLRRAAANPTRLEKMLGAFSTLNPDASKAAANDNKIMYCWGVGPFLEAILTGICGVEANAFAGSVRFRPQIPSAWESMSLTGFGFGGHRLDFRLARGEWEIRHQEGTAPLRIFVGDAHEPRVLPPGQGLKVSRALAQPHFAP